MDLFREYTPALRALAPGLCATLAFGAGGMLLLSSATPSETTRFLWLIERTPALLVNFSHFISSLLGLVLVLVAWGLRRRLDAAWAASVVLTAVTGMLALLKGGNWEETAVLLGLSVLLLGCRPAFDRHAALSRMEVTPGWIVSALVLVAGVGMLGWWSFHQAAPRDELWWRVLAEDDAGRAIRATAGAGVLALAFGIWRLVVTPATPRVVGDDDPDLHRVRAILASAEDPSPEANLALLGDKRFLFSASGQSFLMFGVRGRSWVAIGPPVGRQSERTELLWRFRELADAHAARPSVYGIGPELLPDLVEMGFSIQKIGEFAIVPLENFSVSGRRREVLRRNWRKAAESGASFEVLPREAVPPLMPQLQAISDAWLAAHAGGEKSFTLGGFSPRYVAEFPCAIVRFEGRIVAFATLWTAHDKSALSMDLMRYADDAPRNIMDYLFVELLLWAKAQEYEAFEFGSAPLAGLSDRRLAPALTRVGRLVFERGEEFYNFQGVRRYKDKYDPVWQPRYVAAPHKWAIPLVLADVGLMSSGGVAGLAKRGRKSKADAPAAAPETVTALS
jgi:phosphatidylglycerol lysyltransferase